MCVCLCVCVVCVCVVCVVCVWCVCVCGVCVWCVCVVCVCGVCVKVRSYIQCTTRKFPKTWRRFWCLHIALCRVNMATVRSVGGTAERDIRCIQKLHLGIRTKLEESTNIIVRSGSLCDVQLRALCSCFVEPLAVGTAVQSVMLGTVIYRLSLKLLTSHGKIAQW
jgi:hypothetical protein